MACYEGSSFIYKARSVRVVKWKDNKTLQRTVQYFYILSNLAMKTKNPFGCKAFEAGCYEFNAACREGKENQNQFGGVLKWLISWSKIESGILQIAVLQPAKLCPEKNRRIVFNDHAKTLWISIAGFLVKCIFLSRCNLAEKITLLIVEVSVFFFSHLWRTVDYGV